MCHSKRAMVDMPLRTHVKNILKKLKHNQLLWSWFGFLSMSLGFVEWVELDDC